MIVWSSVIPDQVSLSMHVKIIAQKSKLITYNMSVTTPELKQESNTIPQDLKSLSFS